MRKTTLFRQLAEAPEILMLPCGHDALSAKVIQGAGFKAMAAVGYGAAGSRLGLPDIGLMTATELCEHYRGICQSVDIPVLVDMDTGYGDVNNVIRTLRGLEDAGAAAVFIEDQTFPKRCGHMTGKSVINVDEFLPKLKAALWARRDKDLLVMAVPTPPLFTALTRLFGARKFMKRPGPTPCLWRPWNLWKTCAKSMLLLKRPAWLT